MMGCGGGGGGGGGFTRAIWRPQLKLNRVLNGRDTKWMQQSSCSKMATDGRWGMESKVSGSLRHRRGCDDWEVCVKFKEDAPAAWTLSLRAELIDRPHCWPGWFTMIGP